MDASLVVWLYGRFSLVGWLLGWICFKLRWMTECMLLLLLLLWNVFLPFYPTKKNVTANVCVCVCICFVWFFRAIISLSPLLWITLNLSSSSLPFFFVELNIRKNVIMTGKLWLCRSNCYLFVSVGTEKTWLNRLTK